MDTGPHPDRHRPAGAVGRAPLVRANPVARLVAATIMMLVLFVSVDLTTVSLVLVAEIAAIPLLGTGPGALLRRGWPILLGALSTGFFNAIVAARPGPVVVAVGPVVITTASALVGLGLGLRITGIALAGILALFAVDPTNLGDALIQQARVSHRFAIGAMAALRLLPLFADEWRRIGLARRARGLDAGRSLVRRARLFAGQLHAFLVGAIRRGVRLALAMDARGFDSAGPRTNARPMALHRRDWLLLAAAVAVAVGAVAISVTLGTWRALLA